MEARGRCRLLATSMLGLSAFAFAAPYAHSQCPSTPVVVAETRWRSGGLTVYSGRPWLTAGGDGNVYAGFLMDGVAGLYTSIDGGLSWNDGDFTIGEGTDRLRVAAAPDGTLVATYVVEVVVAGRVVDSLKARSFAPITPVPHGVVSGHRLAPVSHNEIAIQFLGGEEGITGARVFEAVQVENAADEILLSRTTAGCGEIDPAQFGRRLLRRETGREHHDERQAKNCKSHRN